MINGEISKLDNYTKLDRDLVSSIYDTCRLT